MFRMFALIWLYLLRTCLAQNPSSTEDCSPSELTDAVDRRAIVFNASGTLPLKLKAQKSLNIWYISTAVTDERDPKRTFDGGHSRQWIKSFISVPRPLVGSVENDTIGICSYMFQGLNSSSENPDEADGSCKGVISDACIKEFEVSTLPIRAGRNCPISEAFKLSEECKKHLTLKQTVEARNLSTENCTIGKIPYLDVPDGYWTYSGSISSWEGSGVEYDDYDSYDVLVQQTVPIFTVVWGGGISDRKLVCVTPNKVIPGSRKPELKLEGSEEEEGEEDENAASRVGGLGAVFVSVSIMILSLL
ncbi:uncharacterized protein FFB20_03087 [Fusarium fujikuroi]|nr:uncharacterized protein FFB20_03087 [Fusarium fujikuroi]SCO17100.1 uncharacterized protein FFE2_13720 [Fusarium fujikuroi]SCO24184.1 uncharacterized protein FFC1_14992 [Fusarium fujikuroi]